MAALLHVEVVMLCQFARTFPPRLAERLARSKSLKRRFREETATEMLLMGLLGLPPSGLRVDFSDDEAADGADMDWEADWYFVAPNDPKGGSYVRLLIQAKIAMEQTNIKSPYWYYAHLDYAQGQQAQKLVDAAAAASKAILPLYMLFHPAGALQPARGKRPAIAGINLVMAADVHATVTQTLTYGGKTKTGCRRKEKKIDHWRDRFFSLDDLLCYAPAGPASMFSAGLDVTQFALGATADDGDIAEVTAPSWHPDFVAQRLNGLADRGAGHAGRGKAAAPPPVLEPQTIPNGLRRAIDNEESEAERRALPRPRLIFTSPVSRDDPQYGAYAQSNAARHTRRS